MRDAETVTFGGSGLDRAAHLRTDPDQMQALRHAPDSQHIVFWQGKPMVQGDDLGALARLAHDHPLLGDCAADALFLGCDDAGPIWAHLLRDWWPAGLEAPSLAGFSDDSLQSHPTTAPDQVFAELRRVMAQLGARDAELAATGRAMFEWHARHGFCAACGAPSQMADAGWKRTCDQCGAPHFPRTDPVVIMLITRGNSVLVGRSPGWPEGMYSLLAGFVEPGETIEAAVRREVLEESGITVGEVAYLASQPWPFPSSLMLGCAGEATSETIQIDPAELEDAIWVSREEMADAFLGQHPRLKPARNGAIAQFLLRKWLADRLK